MDDSLVPMIISVQYQCHFAVVGNIVVYVTGSVLLSVDDSLVPKIILVQYQCRFAAVGNV